MIYVNHILLLCLATLYYLLFQQGVLTYKEAIDCFFTSGILAVFNVAGLTIWKQFIHIKSIKNQIGFSMLYTLIFFLLFIVQYLNSTQDGKAFTLLLLLNFVVFKICLLLNLLRK